MIGHLTPVMAVKMLQLQDAMNQKTNPAWVTAGYSYHRAISVEGNEAIEHHGWKWWKHQTMDVAQVKMELVDIWHFMLSVLLVEEHGVEHTAASRLLMQADRANDTSGIVFDGKWYQYELLSPLEHLELIVGLAVARRTSVALFMSTMAHLGMSWDELYKQYIGKNVLNFFRQNHGYKEGTYVKTWFGKEDNEVLVELLVMLDVENPRIEQELTGMLTDAYVAAVEHHEAQKQILPY